MRTIAVLLFCLGANLAVAEEVSKALEIQPLEEGIYLHTSYQHYPGFGLVDSNGLVVVVKDQAYIIDTPWSEPDTEELLGWIEARGLTPAASLSTHFHADRTAGIKVLKARSIPTYASELTNTLLLEEGHAQAAQTFSHPSFSLVEGRIEVFYPGPGHSRDNLVVWLPQAQILFGGCLIRPAEAGGLGNTADASIADWAGSVQRVKEAFPGLLQVVPGHGEVGDINMLDHTMALAIKGAKSE
ncbi:DIM/SIM/IMP family subclass B1 metallo-beta-lactamase [Bowmanella dokdonensis]|uniref:beta-lactamase n=1 Tax=Bowmanella dokdonensis TaxID=751969 RepID=A0A939DN32_9ALTE|nr:DIM/SIM/IMP family subclass B1 metallo-beta-lactamase [Bowmanella dokdonensis]MBN7825682.1 DIM/SIM/IMP family subclass B1 metallo-beta-lactamase [Bowmanella dokdonensis]